MRLVAAVAVLVSGAAGMAAPANGTTGAPPPVGGGQAAAAPSGGYEDLDAYVAGRMAATRTPGLAYAVVGPEGILHQRTWGRDGNGQPVTADTPFLWGSVSKPVTATAVMTLVEDGRVDLDAPVRRYLPWFTLADAAAADRITVRQLLTHTSGLPEHAGVTDRFATGADPYREAVCDLAGVAPVAEPGRRHRYSSANYLVLGAMVEKVTGVPYAEYLREAVLRPAGMTGAIADPQLAHALLPPGHRYVAGRPVAMTTPYDPAGPSYGYLGGTLRDLARFAAAHLNGGGGVVSPGSVAAMHTGVVPVAEHHAYGLGWRDVRRDGVRMVWHAGAVAGYQATVVLLPGHHRGVVVLQNVYGYFQDAALVAVALNAARLVAGAAPREVAADARYPLVLGLLGATVLGLSAALGWSVWRLVRPGPGRGRRRIVAGTASWALAGGAAALGAGVAVPSAAGVPLSVFSLYAPDVGWGLAVVAGSGALLVPVRVAVGWRRLRLARAGQRPASPSRSRIQASTNASSRQAS